MIGEKLSRLLYSFELLLINSGGSGPQEIESAAGEDPRPLPLENPSLSPTTQVATRVRYGGFLSLTTLGLGMKLE